MLAGMMLSVRAVALFAAVTLFAAPSLAQGPSPDEPQPIPMPRAPATPDAGPPKAAQGRAQKPLGLEGDERRAVDELLGRLSKTDDASSAKRIAAAVQALWRRSGSDTIDLLTSRSIEAQRGRKLDVAVKLMDEVVSLKPDYAEGWNRRATLHFAAKDQDAAMADLHEALVREPRQYTAWLALGRILADAELDRQALAAFRKALDIYPAIEGLKKEVDDLALKVEGQPI